MPTQETPHRVLPADLAKSIEGQDGSSASTVLASHRTGLADLRSHLANERTHLAYLRTAISLIGFGITINRFSIFLQQKGTLDPTSGGAAMRHSEYAGAGMVAVGLLLLAWSIYRYWHVNQDIVHASFRPLHKMVISLSAALLLGGGASVAWMILQH